MQIIATLCCSLLATFSVPLVTGTRIIHAGAVAGNSASSADPNKPWKRTVEHQKVPGNGYKPGSPLHAVQQHRKTEPANATSEDPVKELVDDTEDLPSHPDEIGHVYQKWYGRLTGEYLLWGIADAILTFILILIFAWVYHHHKTDPTIPPPGHTAEQLDGDFRYGIFACLGDPSICLMSCCCPAIRWADTMRMASLMGFWMAVIIFGVLEAFYFLLSGLTLWCICCLGMLHRQKIRELFEMEHGHAKDLGLDCFFWLCCPCCAIAQEARQLEEAYAVGHPRFVKVETFEKSSATASLLRNYR